MDSFGIEIVHDYYKIILGLLLKKKTKNDYIRNKRELYTNYRGHYTRTKYIKYNTINYQYELSSITKKIYDSLPKNVEIINKDKKFNANYHVVTSLFPYFKLHLDFEDEKKSEMKTIKFDKDLKYIKMIYQMFVENKHPNASTIKPGSILELIDMANFLLIDNENIMTFIKYTALEVILMNIYTIDYKILNKLNDTLFNNYLDIQLIDILKKHKTNHEIEITKLFRCLDLLIVDSKKEPEDFKDMLKRYVKKN